MERSTFKLNARQVPRLLSVGRRAAIACIALLIACDGAPPSDPSGGGLEGGAPAGAQLADMGGAKGGVPSAGVMTGGEAGGEAGGEPSDEALCEPCAVDEASSCPVSFECILAPLKEDGTREAPFCTRTCEDRACPSGYRCESASEGGAGGVEGGAAEGSGERRCLPIADSCTPVFCTDEDGDGYGRGRDCLGLDCDDENPDVHVGVTLDLCDGVDNNCNGTIDEGFEPAACGEGACGGLTACVDGVERCDAAGMTSPDEGCDGVDDDCDGQVDEGYQAEPCGFGVCQALSACVSGVVSCEPQPPAVGDSDEVCDLIDSDCDGLLDEGFTGETCGVGVCQVRASCTETGAACTPLQATGNDSNCNQLDDDCDGRVDEGFMGAASCGVGACRQVEYCSPDGVTCREGNPLSATDDTCDGVDDNCNGLLDEGCASNVLSFELVLNEVDAITVAITLDRGEEVGPPNLQTLPSRLDLHLTLPDGLSLPPGSVSLGAVPISLGITEGVSDSDPRPDYVRLFFPFSTPAAYQVMMPGELLRLRFTKAPGAQGPFSFEWVEGEPFTDLNGNGACESNSGEPYTDLNGNGVCDANTTLSPPVARSILILSNASLGGP